MVQRLLSTEEACHGMTTGQSPIFDRSMECNNFWLTGLSRAIGITWSFPPFLREVSRFWSFTMESSLFSPSIRLISGRCKLQNGYMFAVLPRDTHIVSEQGGHGESMNIPSTRNFSWAIFALFQLIYASLTLYRARGDQLDRYGYAAFRLTVLPYVIMSAVNLTANLLMPDYPRMTMVSSDIMEEAKARGSVFEGVCGRLELESESEPAETSQVLVSGHFEAISDAKTGEGAVKEMSSMVADAPAQPLQEADNPGQGTTPDDDASGNHRQPGSEAGLAEAIQREASSESQVREDDPESEDHSGFTSSAPSLRNHSTWFNPTHFFRLQESETSTENRKPDLSVTALSTTNFSEHVVKDSWPALIVPACSRMKRSKASLEGYTYYQDDGFALGYSTGSSMLRFLVILSIGSLPIVVVGALSRFDPGHSTVAQRVWMMLWLVMHIVVAPLINVYRIDTATTTAGYESFDAVAKLYAMTVYALPALVPAIGGMVVVGKMLIEFGGCARLY